MDITASQLFRQYFTGEPTHLAFAPGRIEFIGNHTDYNGGLVMGAAVNKGITVAVRLRDDSLIKIVSDMGNLTECSLGNFKPVLGVDSATARHGQRSRGRLQEGRDIGFDVSKLVTVLSIR